MTGLAQRGGKPVARVEPEGFSRPPIASNALAPGALCPAIPDNGPAAQVASYRCGVEGDGSSGPRPGGGPSGYLVDLQGILEAAEPQVIHCDIIPYVHGTLVIYAKGHFEFWQNAQVQFQRLTELAVRAQVLAVKGLTHQEYPEPSPSVYCWSKGGSAGSAHERRRRGRLYTSRWRPHRHGQHLQVIFAEAFPPYSQRVLTELQRLDMGAAQPQPPYLVDDEVAQCQVIVRRNL